MTFSIVARDPITGEIGAATATGGPAVGALVLHGASHFGAIATQAMTNPIAGLTGIRLLQQSNSASSCLETLLTHDQAPSLRQLIIIDAQGESADWTGQECLPWCGSLSETNLAIAGNMLAGEQVLVAMQTHFHQNKSLPLADRLLSAMKAGAECGGDQRGIRSAALKVWHQRHYADIDIRADWSESPLTELTTILSQIRSADYANFFAQIPTGNER
nr:DUF1028 domain-containing protein [uncultured Moellerella sp.]